MGKTKTGNDLSRIGGQLNLALATSVSHQQKQQFFMANISVALATYNGGTYLRAQLESISSQTTFPAELIVIDDDSSDDTIKIAQEFAKKAPFQVRIIQNRSRIGYRANFMHAATACKSDLFAFCDQDDIWDPRKLSLMQRAFDDPDVLLAYHNSTLIDENGKASGTLFPKRSATFHPLTKHPWTIIPGHAQVIRRSLLRLTPLHSSSLDPYSLNDFMPHDQWYPFWASVLGNIVYVRESLAQYRQHQGNVSGWPHANLRAYVLDHISNAANYIKGEAAAARNRLKLVDSCRALLNHDEISRIDAAIGYYEDVCIRSELRYEIYRSKTLYKRLRALLTLVKSGAYFGEQSEALGLAALLLDSTVGAPFSHYFELLC